MNDLENLLRRTMREHDDEAPTLAESRLERVAVDRPTGRPRRPRPRTWLAVGASAAVVAVIAAVLAVTGQPGARHRTAGGLSKTPGASAVTGQSALSCPATMPRTPNLTTPWVPAKPVGVDGSARLVPQQTPTTAVACGYGLGPATGGGAASLSGSRVLTGGLAALAAQLTWQPRQLDADRPCATYTTPLDGAYFLLGLRYPHATVWVALPGNHCSASSNGQFTTPANLAQQADAAYRSGTWTAAVTPPRGGTTPAPAPCAASGVGRLGQGRAMVPAGLTSVEVCQLSRAGTGKTHRTVTPTAAHDIVAALNKLPARPYGYQCTPQTPGGGPGTTYQLLFHYRTGPPVAVAVTPWCSPSVQNGSLQSASATSVASLIQALLDEPHH